MLRTVFVVLLASVFLLPAAAMAINPEISLVEGASSGSTVKVIIHVKPNGLTMISSVFTVEYHSDCLTFVDAERSAGASAYVDEDLIWNTDPTPPFATTGADYDQHVLILLRDMTIPPDPDANYSIEGDIVVLNFEATGPGTCRLNLDTRDLAHLPTRLTDADGEDHYHDGLDYLGPLDVVVESASISGVARAYDSGDPLEGVQVDAEQGLGHSEDTDGDGEYLFSHLFDNGDVLMSATLTSSPADESAISGGDVNTLFELAAPAATPSREQIRLGDMIAKPALDGDIGLDDALGAAKWLIYLDPCDGAIGCTSYISTWVFDFTQTSPDPQGPSEDEITVNIHDLQDAVVDLTGYLKGDMDGSWPNRSGKAQLPSPASVALQVVSWDGDEAIVALRSEPNGESLESLVYSLTYDASALGYVGCEKDAAVEGFIGMENPKTPGVVHGVLLGGGRKLSSAGDLLRFRMRVLDGQASGRVTFSRLLVNDRSVSGVPDLNLSRGETNLSTLPADFRLGIHPNPFNPSAQIEYGIPATVASVPVKLAIYDVAGHLVRTLADAHETPGNYHLTWDGRDQTGEPVSAGSYFVRFHAGDFAKVQRITLVK